MSDFVIRRATAVDAPGIAACVCEAYLHYIERIGRQPGPMLDDYEAVIAESEVHVAKSGETVVGAIVLMVTGDGFYIDNVAVRRSVKGQGVGRKLLELAEAQARREGYKSICLATHELMVENQVLYAGIGYTRYDRRVVNGFPRIFFRKELP